MFIELSRRNGPALFVLLDLYTSYSSTYKHGNEIKELLVMTIIQTEEEEEKELCKYLGYNISSFFVFVKYFQSNLFLLAV
jgi:hypothetical protein